MREYNTTAEKRNYVVLNTDDAKKIAFKYLDNNGFNMNLITYGLPEIHDRYDVWNVPIIYKNKVIGTVAINAHSGEINADLSTNLDIFWSRLTNQVGESIKTKKTEKFKYIISDLKNTLVKGRTEIVLKSLPEQCIDMIFTSPPYYNARKEYSEYATYEDYLDLMRDVIRECHRVLINGKFFIMNSSHVLVPRTSRNESSSRIPVPFDLHQIFIEEGFEFVDDIIWQKPEGAGWASGRGRRFSADRNPLQYKAVPVTEYVMVYRKKPTVLIDYFIRKHPNPNIIKESKIADGYEKTNVWYISPARDKRHPAIFPKELASKVIQYYSFKNDIVLDPFGGIGTTAKSALELERRFYSIELNTDYIEATKNDLLKTQKNLSGNLEYDYIDATLNSENNDYTSPVSLRHIIADMLSNGYSEQDLIEKLKK